MKGTLSTIPLCGSMSWLTSGLMSARGKECWDNEAEAQLIALALLAEAGEWGAVFTAMEWMLALSASDMVLDQLNLPAKEYRYYQVVNINHLKVVKMLVNDEDGIFQLRTGDFDAGKLWQFLRTLPE